MGRIIIQIYRCARCNMVFEIHSYGVFYPPCPFCGKSAPYYVGEKKIET